MIPLLAHWIGAIVLLIVAIALEKLVYKYEHFYTRHIDGIQPVAQHPTAILVFYFFFVTTASLLIREFFLKPYFPDTSLNFYLGFAYSYCAFHISYWIMALIMSYHVYKYPEDIEGSTTVSSSYLYISALTFVMPAALFMMVIPFFTMTAYTLGAAFGAAMILLGRFLKIKGGFKTKNH